MNPEDIIKKIKSKRALYNETIALDGKAGKNGSQGEKGIKGDKGEKGEKGEKGNPGIDGIDGKQGARGEKGENGENGKEGQKGEKGIKGDKGEKGEKGNPGIDGVNGINGNDGKDGRYVTDVIKDEENHLIVKLSDDTVIDAGKLPSVEIGSYSNSSLPYLMPNNLTTYNFASANISQWTNDAEYITSGDLSGYVPYTGATSNIILGAYTITAANLSGTNTGDVTLAGQNYLSLTNQIITANAIDVSGTNITGVLKAASFPALTGDITTVAGALATTLATVNSNVGTFGSGTQIPTFTVNAKGLITAATNVALSGVAVTSITGTANQISASASTGAVTLSLTNGISLGTLAATTPPTGGILASGGAIFRNGGATVGTAYFQVTPVSSAASGTLNAMFLGAGTLTATAGSDTINLITVTNTTIARAGFGGLTFTGINLQCSGFSATGGGSNAVAYGIKGTGFASLATTQYTAYFGVGTGGTNNIALYTDNQVIGTSFIGVNAVTNGLLVQSNTSIGSTSSNSLFNVGSSNQFQVNSIGFWRIGGAPSATIQAYINQSFTATSGALAALQIQSPMGASSGTLSEVDSIFISTDLSANVGTVTFASSINIGAGSTAGTVTTGVGLNINALAFGTNRYGLKVAAPAAGTVAIATYTENLVVGASFISNNPPANGAIIAGNVYIGASSNSFSNMQFLLQGSSTTQTGVFANATSTIARTWFLNNSNSFAFGIDSDNTAALYNNINSVSRVWAVGSAGGLSIGFGSTAAPSAGLAVSGRVGINTTAPVGILHAFSGTTGAFFTNTDFVNASAGSGFYIQTASSSGNVDSQIQSFKAGNTAVGNLYINPFGGLTTVGTSTFVNDAALPLQLNVISTQERYLSINKAGVPGLIVGYSNAGGFGTAGIIRMVASDPLNFYVQNTALAMQLASDGTVAIGGGASSSAVAQLKVNPWSTIAYNIQSNGTIVNTDSGTSSGSQIGIAQYNTFSPTNGAVACYSVYSVPVFACPSGKTISSAVYCGYFSPRFTGNAGTIDKSYGILIEAPVLVGTVNTAYSLYVARPVCATTNYTAYLDPVIGIGDVPHQNSVINLGGGAFYNGIRHGGTLSTKDGGNNQVGWYNFLSFQPPSGASSVFCVAITPTINTTNSSVSVAYGCYIAPNAKTGGNTLTDHYTLYVSKPSGAVNNHTAYFDTVIGMGINPSADKILSIAGNVVRPPTAGGSYGLYLTPSLGVSSSSLVEGMAIYISPIFASNVGTVGTGVGLFIDAGTTAGTITTGYSLFVKIPSYGTTKRCAFFEGAIQYGINTTGVGTALLGTTNCPATTLSAPYVWINAIAPDGSTVYIPAWK